MQTHQISGQTTKINEEGFTVESPDGTPANARREGIGPLIEKQPDRHRFAPRGGGAMGTDPGTAATPHALGSALRNCETSFPPIPGAWRK
ncbi:MAG: hypothetical protein ACYC7A_11705 [Thermoanaerobaculia bacterium]